jgi:hypothetical protein
MNQFSSQDESMDISIFKDTNIPNNGYNPYNPPVTSPSDMAMTLFPFTMKASAFIIAQK